MARDKNQSDTIRITISTSPQVAEALDVLVESGFFGKSRATVAESLLREKVRQLKVDGELKPGDEE